MFFRGIYFVERAIFGGDFIARLKFGFSCSERYFFVFFFF